MKKNIFNFKIFFIFLLVLNLFFIGGCRNCEKGKNTTENSKNFELVASYKKNDIDYEAIISQAAAKTSITFKKPKEIENFRLGFNGNEISASFAGVEISSDEEDLDFLNFSTPKMIARAIQDSVGKNGLKIEGLTEYGRYILNRDGKKSIPTSLKILDEDLYCNFEKLRS